MIPKIIHLCWLSGDPFPAEIKKCLETWNDKLKDYSIWLWGKAPESVKVNGYRLTVNENIRVNDEGLTVIVKEFDLNSTAWTRQAFEAKKYAFAADYIRLHALYNYGGIYLDADVIVYKPFDELLSLPYFIGRDQICAFEAAVIGAEKGCKWIKNIFDTYKEKNFIKEDGSYDMLELPVRFHHVLTGLGYRFVRVNDYGLRVNENKRGYGEGLRVNDFENKKIIYVFDKDFFNSRDAVEIHPSKNSFCAHNYAGAWQEKVKVNGYGLTVKVKKMMPKWMLKIVYTIGQKTWARNKYSWFQIPFER